MRSLLLTGDLVELGSAALFVLLLCRRRGPPRPGAELPRLPPPVSSALVQFVW